MEKGYQCLSECDDEEEPERDEHMMLKSSQFLAECQVSVSGLMSLHLNAFELVITSERCYREKAEKKNKDEREKDDLK